MRELFHLLPLHFPHALLLTISLHKTGVDNFRLLEVYYPLFLWTVRSISIVFTHHIIKIASLLCHRRRAPPGTTMGRITHCPRLGHGRVSAVLYTLSLCLPLRWITRKIDSPAAQLLLVAPILLHLPPFNAFPFVWSFANHSFAHFTFAGQMSFLRPSLALSFDTHSPALLFESY